MKSLLDKFLNYNIPLKERLLYIATSMCSICSLFVVFSGYFLGVDLAGIILFFVLSVVFLAIFYFEYKTHKTELCSHIFLSFINIILFPFAVLLSGRADFEIPVYALIGLVYSLVLTEGVSRLVHFSLTVVIVVSIFVYNYNFTQSETVIFEGLSVFGFVRTEFAILITSILVGTTIFYRNRCLEKDLEYQKKLDSEAEMTSYAKDMFLVNISHEIRTPLNAIIGTTSVLLESEANNHIKEMASNIYNSSFALLSITNDLLDFSNMANDNIVLNDKQYDLSLMLKDIINLMSVSILDLSFNLYANINPAIPKNLIGDSNKLRQVIINFLTNAAKYTKEGRIIFSVDYENISDTDIKLIISVEDTGIGMNEEQLASVFLPPKQDVRESDFETKGLGLPLVKRIADTMNAKLSVSSEVGKGTIFIFEVNQKIDLDQNSGCLGEIVNKPSICFFVENHYESKRLEYIFNIMSLSYTIVYSDNNFCELINDNSFDYYFIEEDAYYRVKSSIKDKPIDWKKIVVITSCNYSFVDEPFEYVLTKPVSCLNISDLINENKNYNIKKNNYEGEFTIPDANVLVVDDNLINLDVTEGLLARFKCHVLKATSGNDAILCIKNNNVDFVLLDYMMPEMDGIDTLKLIRKIDDGKYSSLPVVAFTANAISGAYDLFVNEGFNNYLSKPIEIDKLANMLKEYISQDKIHYLT